MSGPARTLLGLACGIVLLGCGAASEGKIRGGEDASKGAAHPWLAALTVSDLVLVEPESAEAAAATKPRGDAVFVDGALVYRGATAGLVIAELSVDGKQLLERAVVYLPGAGNDVVVHGGTAFVACGSAGLAVIDVSQPTAPRPLALVDTPGSVLRLSRAGELLLLADGALGVVVLDVSTPARPVPRAAWRTAGGYARQAVWDGDGILVAAGRVGVVRLALADGPELVERWRFAAGGQARALAVAGGRVLVADGPRGLLVLDPGDGNEPRGIGRVELADMARDVTADATGEVAFVASGDDGIIVIDVTDPAAPARVGEHVPDKPANRVLRLGDRLYVGNDSDGLLVLDIATPATPAQLFPPAE